MDRLKKYAPLLLRVGIALVFLWFGANQMFAPSGFLGYLPTWAPAMMSRTVDGIGMMGGGMSASTASVILIRGNGLLEIALGLLLVTGLFTRIAALLLGLHLTSIMLLLGYNDIAVRDFGLICATLSIALSGPDDWCLDSRIQSQEKK